MIALNPDGTTKWTYTPEPADGLLAGPAVGPDGTIFAVQEELDFGGLGAFALNPDGFNGDGVIGPADLAQLLAS